MPGLVPREAGLRARGERGEGPLLLLFGVRPPARRELLRPVAVPGGQRPLLRPQR